jgi:methylated-DNA-[protein]-cysteine S-methyltransferase
MGLTQFQKRVYNILRRVPRGRVTSYQEIAKALGNKNLARAVGNALNKNPFAPRVPCHRVINSDGTLGGYASGARRKKKLLLAERVKFSRDGKILGQNIFKF